MSSSCMWSPLTREEILKFHVYVSSISGFLPVESFRVADFSCVILIAEQVSGHGGTFGPQSRLSCM